MQNDIGNVKLRLNLPFQPIKRLFQEILEMKNSAGKTTDDMLSLFLLLPKDHLFKHFLDVVNPYLGGEEINKTWIGHQTHEVFRCRSDLTSKLRERLKQDYTLAELRGFNLTTIS